MIEKFLQGLKSGFRSEAGSVLSPNFETSPGKAMVDRSNIISQLRALGLSKERLADLELEREEGDDLFRQRSYLVRDAKSKRELAGAMLGTVAADIASDGMRNIWWFINAPQALTQVATQQAIASGAGAKNLSQPLIANRATRMAATLPAVIGMSMGIGQFGREPGFKATIPDSEDPTQTADPVGEFVNRYFLGRAGNILPYEEFVKERPDVSPEEYRDYKRYLFSNKGVLKATDEGVLGPEVTFMGKSIPVSTALAPSVAGVIGAGIGARRAARKAGNQLRQKELSVKERNELDAMAAKTILGYGGGATAGAALAGQLLESIRRQMGSGDNE